MEIKKKSWDSIGIADYRKIRDLNLDKDLSETEKGMALLAILCDVDENEVWNLSVGEVQGLLSQISWVNDFKVDEKKYRHYDINGVRYDIELDVNKMTVSQYVDFQNYAKSGVTPENMAEILSCFLIPEGKKYNEDYDIVKTVKDIDEYLPFPKAQGLLFFYLRGLQSSIKALRVYSAWQAKKMMKGSPRKEVRAKIKEMDEMLQKMEWLGFHSLMK